MILGPMGWNRRTGVTGRLNGRNVQRQEKPGVRSTVGKMLQSINPEERGTVAKGRETVRG